MTENSTLADVSGEAMGREFHAVADLFPLLRGAAFDELVADIKKNGLREAILVDGEGRILDGRNRYRACLQAGVEPRFVQWQGEEPLAELALSLNLRRRHLNESQRAMVAARLAKMLEKEAAQRRGARTDIQANLPGSQFGQVRDKAGGLVNVSPRLISHATKVLRDGCAELIAAVECGELAVSTASALAGLPRDEQAQAVAGGIKQAAAKVREIRASKSTASAPRPSPGQFGVLCAKASEESAPAGGLHGVVLIWVAAANLAAAVTALRAHGFQHTSSLEPQMNTDEH